MKHLIPFALFMLMPAHGFSQQYISYDYNLSNFYQLGAKYLRMKYIVYVLMAF